MSVRARIPLAWCLGLVLVGGFSRALADDGGEVEPTDWVQKIEEGLQKPIDVDFEYLQLIECLNYLGKTSGIDLWIDTEGISREGQSANLEVEVTLKLPGRRLETLLNLLLQRHDLGWLIEDDVLKITTRAREENTLEVRSRDISTFRTRGVELEDLMETLETSIAPDSWGETGGPGSLRLLGNHLVIRQTQRNHREIERLLSELEESPHLDAVPPMKSPVTLKVYPVENGTEDGIARVIPELIAPETWSKGADDEKVGRIQSTPGVLLIRQTGSEHRRIRKLLEELKTKSAEQKAKERGSSF